MQVSQAWIPGDDLERSRHGDPVPNFERWLLERYCFNAKGEPVPEIVDALDRWSLDRLEQVHGLRIEAADRAAAWSEWQHARAQIREQKLAEAGIARPSAAEIGGFGRGR